eukprot:CAMPEP_0172585274 /NCGR_PEP_ID=MMETSP1068-20121228/4692_1 /TAXON_ID=35684 /ORGANISM="Pseudopedinella elastica, Strain CCMP716" /LENGTH=347 /DNA_ID=CAMNT_0013379663 /DNA_START=11 /DNA_END=1051 /DNA_ORIENTATION=+
MKWTCLACTISVANAFTTQYLPPGRLRRVGVVERGQKHDDTSSTSRRLILFGDPEIVDGQLAFISSEYAWPVWDGDAPPQGSYTWILAGGAPPRMPFDQRSVKASDADLIIVLKGIQGVGDGAVTEDDLSGAFKGAEVVSVDASGSQGDTSRAVRSVLEAFFELDDNFDGVQVGGPVEAGSVLTDSDLCLNFVPSFGSAAESEASVETLIAALEAGADQPGVDFGGLRLAPIFHDSLVDRGYSGLTPIQSSAAKVLLGGESAFLHSETGSGKTLAYLLPILQRLVTQRGGLVKAPPCSLVVCVPTRELGDQIFREIKLLLPGADKAPVGERALAELVDMPAEPSRRA